MKAIIWGLMGFALFFLFLSVFISVFSRGFGFILLLISLAMIGGVIRLGFRPGGILRKERIIETWSVPRRIKPTAIAGIADMDNDERLIIRLKVRRDWLGFLGFRGKTLWDLMGLLIVPLFIAGATLFFSFSSFRERNSVSGLSSNLKTDVPKPSNKLKMTVYDRVYCRHTYRIWQNCCYMKG
jgi:hypothetical protein